MLGIKYLSRRLIVESSHGEQRERGTTSTRVLDDRGMLQSPFARNPEQLKPLDILMRQLKREAEEEVSTRYPEEHFAGRENTRQ